MDWYLRGGNKLGELASASCRFVDCSSNQTSRARTDPGVATPPPAANSINLTASSAVHLQGSSANAHCLITLTTAGASHPSHFLLITRFEEEQIAVHSC